MLKRFFLQKEKILILIFLEDIMKRHLSFRNENSKKEE